jgi:G3E family GTPase
MAHHKNTPVSKPGGNAYAMNLLVVSGLLGSGKTTLILELAKAALKRSIKVALVVNEIGEIGIDNQFMKQLGMNVWEILGGCVCCSLSGSLKDTLSKLEAEHDIDLVILEPSGAADLKFIDRIIHDNDLKNLGVLNKITVVDPLRFEMMMTVITPLATSQIQSAAWVIITKKDLA